MKKGELISFSFLNKIKKVRLILLEIDYFSLGEKF